MRKSIFILAAAALLGFASCNDLTPDFSKEEKNCTIALSVKGDIATVVTKAGGESHGPSSNPSKTTETEWDTLVTDVQYMIYRKVSDNNYVYYDKKHDTTRIHTKYVNCAPGDYRVYAVINTFDIADHTTEADLNAKIIQLGNNTRVRNANSFGGFIMFGHSDITIEAGNKDLPIQVKRHLARVNLLKIINRTEDNINIKFKYAFLSNVVTNQKLDGSSTSNYNDYSWDNLAGRASGQILDYDHLSYVQDSHLTLYKQPDDSDTVKGKLIEPGGEYKLNPDGHQDLGEMFYGYPNAWTTDAFNTPYEAESPTYGKTRLVVVCAMQDVSEPAEQDYYFPITLETFERSYTYDITLTVLGVGSDDPNTLVNKAGMHFSIDPWQSNNSYVEEY